MNNNIHVITFDADDTLWVNETYFQQTRYEFGKLLEQYMPYDQIEKELSHVESLDIPFYGYGVKPFTLSMLEAAARIAGNKLTSEIVTQIINLGKGILSQKVELLPGIEEVLSTLHGKYRLAVATKGDLLDQRRKLHNSGLEHYFDHIEIMSDKTPADYQRILNALDCRPENFLMIGNSLRSDILPVLELGGYAIHIPFSVTWDHEKVEGKINNANFTPINDIAEVIVWLKQLKAA